MPIYTIAQYRVRPQGVEKVKQSIEEFVPYVKANEPGTRMYLAWQQQTDPARFVHFFIFEDEAAHLAHGRSAAVKQFEAAYRPELDGGEVVFTDYNMVATNLPEGENILGGSRAATIRHSIQISATPEQIYPLFATAGGFGQWWATDITEPAGAVELGFFNRTTVYRLRLQADQPPEKAEWACETGDEWNGTRIAFHMEAAKSGTLLGFTHAGWRTESAYFVSCNTTWGELLFRLKACAEGHAPGPLFSRDGTAY